MHGSSGGSSSFLDGFIDFTSGSLGAVALVYVGQPLDTVKVKLQTFPHMYTGPIDCLKTTLKTEGLARGLYAGTIPALAANIAENSVLFAAYGVCQRAVMTVTKTPRVEDLSATANGLAGFLAAFFSSFSLCPTELIKVKLQAAREVALASSGSDITTAVSHTVRPPTAYRLTRSILANEGIRGMFRGLGSTMLREMPGYFVFFGAYEGTRSLLTPPGKSKNDCGALATMVAGAAGGLALWTAVFPADLVKSRIQVASSSSDSFYSMTLNVVKKEGFSGLYSGLTPTLIRTIPATAVLFLTYENSKKLLHSLFD